MFCKLEGLWKWKYWAFQYNPVIGTNNEGGAEMNAVEFMRKN